MFDCNDITLFLFRIGNYSGDKCLDYNCGGGKCEWAMVNWEIFGVKNVRMGNVRGEKYYNGKCPG